MTAMNIDDFFPSNYLEPADLQGKRLPVKISLISTEKFGRDQWPVIWFHGMKKGLILRHKVKAKAIKTITGTGDMSQWVGVRCVLYPTTVSYAGQNYDVIRIDRLTNMDSGAAS